MSSKDPFAEEWDFSQGLGYTKKAMGNHGLFVGGAPGMGDSNGENPLGLAVGTTSQRQGVHREVESEETGGKSRPDERNRI